MITDDDVQIAIDYLWDNAGPASKARAERVYMEEYRKSLKAILKKKSNAKSNAAQEDDAYADHEYQDHLIWLRKAVENDEKHRWLRVAAEAKIQAWRTQKSYNKTMGELQ